MILGAMVAAGVDPNVSPQQLSALHVRGFSIEFETVNRSGLSATYARVETAHEHKHRHLSDIRQIIDRLVAFSCSEATRSRRSLRVLPKPKHVCTTSRSIMFTFTRLVRSMRSSTLLERQSALTLLEVRSVRLFATARRQWYGSNGPWSVSSTTARRRRAA